MTKTVILQIQRFYQNNNAKKQPDFFPEREINRVQVGMQKKTFLWNRELSF